MKPQYRLETQLTPRAKDTIGNFPKRNPKCECGSFVDHTDHCGCCGVEISADQWCARCKRHLLANHLPPWERTWFAQFGKQCPYDPYPTEVIQR